jgi:hypothetical protein
MGSSRVLPLIKQNAVDTERYVWSSRRQLANESPGLRGESKSEGDSPSLKTTFGRKRAKVTRVHFVGESSS